MKRMDKIRATITAAAAAFFSFFGLLAIPLLLLAPCQVIDWFTGIAASKVQSIEIKSDISFAGIVKKVCMYLLIFVGWALDMLIAYLITNMHIDIVLPNIIACIIAVWLVLNELISITENIAILGINGPFLSPIMKLIKNKVEDTVKIEEDK